MAEQPCVKKRCHQSTIMVVVVLIISVGATPLNSGDEGPNCPRLNELIDCYSTSRVIHSRRHSWGLELNLSAFNSEILTLNLEVLDVNGQQSVISPQLKVKVHGKDGFETFHPKIREYYYGSVGNQTQTSSAHGYFNGVIFIGIVKFKDRVLQFESAAKYLHGSAPNTMVVYLDKDAHFPRNHTFISPQLNMSDTVDESYVYNIRSNQDDILSRKKRQAGTLKICTLSIHVDHTYYAFVTRGVEEDEHRAYVIADVLFHVTESSGTFKNTDFDGDGVRSNLVFRVDIIEIFPDTDSDDYLLASVTRDATATLRTFTEYDFDGLCLAVLLCRREFDEGVIGLAWTGSTRISPSATGMCQPRVRFSSGFKSYNTLLVTNINLGQTLSRPVSALTFTHEFGHSFGARHDDAAGNPGSCAPGGSRGNYIMHSLANDADLPNNIIFSMCSKEAISPVIFLKGPECLIEIEETMCGNQVVDLDEGEECDCGLSQYQCRDMCCNTVTCMLASNAQCSPRVSRDCCNSDCTFNTDTSIECLAETDCAEASTCSGTSAECPTPTPKADDLLCMGEQRRCLNGECTVSRCEDLGLSVCLCQEVVNGCQLCCRENDNDDSVCMTAFSLGIMTTDNGPIMFDAGQTCFQGYCDSDGECMYFRDVASSLELLIDSSLAARALKFIQNYWFLTFFLVAGIGLIITVVILSRKSKKVGSIGYHTRDEITSLLDEAQHDIKLFDNMILKSRHQIETRHNKLTTLKNTTDCVERLAGFFPYSEVSELRQIKMHTVTEADAVELLIELNHPMRVVPETASSISLNDIKDFLGEYENSMIHLHV